MNTNCVFNQSRSRSTEFYDPSRRLRRSWFAGKSLYEYRLDANQHEMPDAIAAIESDVVYLCDNGGGGAVIRRGDRIRGALGRVFGDIIVDEI